MISLAAGSTTNTTSAASTVLSSSSDFVVLGVMTGLILASGALIVWGRKFLVSPRRTQRSGLFRRAAVLPADGTTAGTSSLGGSKTSQLDDSNSTDSTLVRSWIAIALVSGLLVFCAVAFAIDDSSLRSTLFGGLVTMVGGAVAFYFSSKSADQARQDLMNAAVGTTSVPDLVGNPPGKLTLADAHAAIAKTALQLAVEDPTATPQATVVGQSPSAYMQVRNGSRVTVKTAEPTPGATPTPGPTPTPPPVPG